MRPRIILSLALLVCAFGMERLAYYMMRSTMALELRAAHLAPSEISSGYTTVAVSSVAAMLVGGVVAIAIGPRTLAIVGAVIAMLGHFLLAAGGASTPFFFVVALGSGLLRPCVLAAAAEGLWTDAEDGKSGPPSPQRFLAVGAFSAAAYGVANVGAFVSSLVSGYLSVRFAPGLGHVIAGVVMFFAVVMSGLAALLAQSPPPKPDFVAAPNNPYRVAAFVPPAITSSPTATGLAGLAVIAVPTIVFMLGSDASYTPFDAHLPEWTYSVSPIVGTFCAVGLAALFAIAASSRSTFPLMVVFGLGLVVAALGFIPIAFVSKSGDAMLYALGVATFSLGEVAVYAVGGAYAALAVPSRSRTLVVAGWSAISTLVSILGTAFAVDYRMPILLGAALLCFLFGAAFAAVARQLHTGLFDAVGSSPDPTGFDARSAAANVAPR